MKIRNGFVSNSSTSSFICIGWSGNKLNDPEVINDIKEYLKKNNIEYNERDSIQDMIELNLLGTFVSYYYEEYGKSMFGYKLKDFMTLKNLKEHIKKVEELCEDPDDIFFIFKKHFGEPCFDTIVSVNY